MGRGNLIFVMAVVFMFSLSAIHVLAQEIDYCEGNFDCDQDVDGMDAAMFKTDFGRSSIFNECPTCPPIERIAKTGQTSCYDDLGNVIDCAGTGQDGEYQTGYERFKDNGNETVTDNFTGLMWTKSGRITDGNPKLWLEALVVCRDLNLAGYDDWRLPNVFEMKDLVDVSYQVPYFIDPQSGFYWTSTTWSMNPIYAWAVYNGYDQAKHYAPKLKDPDKYYVWCVRGGQ